MSMSALELQPASLKPGAAIRIIPAGYFRTKDGRPSGQINDWHLNAAIASALIATLTDITVGLSTGQSPFTVLMQQGGQLKDSFGGAIPAIRAVSGAVMGMVNPYTVAITLHRP